ncbi:MAG: nucleotidyltransferase domain-containing protein [Candidatus Anammoxibacter sp.]
MKSIDQLKLRDNEVKALQEFKQNLLKGFPDAEITLYGSKARGEDGEFSDIDVLVLLNCKVNNSLEEDVFSVAFQVELKYDVIFGIIVYSKDFWSSKLGKAMPIHWSVDKEGIPVKKDLEWI